MSKHRGQRSPTPLGGRTFLFQYGSNMTEEVLGEKIRGHLTTFAPQGSRAELRSLGAARLQGWRFTLGLYSSTGRHLVADIVEAPGDEVWGVLYELPVELVKRSDGERSVLDRIEGHRTSRDPENYEPREVDVVAGGSVVRAWTYVGREDARKRCEREHGNAVVSASYAKSILEGARAFAAPDAYLAKLEAALARHTA